MPSLLDNKRWELLPHSGEDERLLCEHLGVSSLVARVLCARGICDVDQARAFLRPSLERDWADPLDIPGMREAADRVELALQRGERIAVFGDFDVDGMTSTCLLTQALRQFGADAHPYIPHRFGEGYGLSHEALQRVMGDSSPDLIITVDNGIASGNEVAWLVEQGIDVVVTDHHEPGDLVPQGVPVTDPKLETDCYSRELAGAGVALKLVCELGRRQGMPNLWREYTDLAALGTVSDMMVLQDENRSLVADGIERIKRSARPGIVALAATAGIDLAQIHADDLPYSLIPRLNAAGRMGTTEVAFDLLICDDPAEATTLAGMLEETNTKRRETEAELSADALSRIKETYDGARVIVVAGEGWHEGVKGIVASRIVSRYHVPAIVFSVTDGIARGSGRSVGSVDLFHAVEQCSDLLVRFGGHSGAVGVTCEVDKIDTFRARLQEVLETLPEEDFVDKGEVAALATLDELSLSNIADLDVLQPFGQGNKRPLFGVRGVFMNNRARVGYDNAHLRFVATDGVSSVPAIMFRAPDIERAVACDGIVDLVVDAINESWQGRTNPKLMVSAIFYRDEPCRDEAVEQGFSDMFKGNTALFEEREEQALPNSFAREDLSGLPHAQLSERIREQMIGDNPLLPAQAQALRILEQGRSTLCVMATGRGKSLIFHLHAARVALEQKSMSIFVYPLRALVSDQAFYLQESLGSFGLAVRVLTGESSVKERSDITRGMKTGDVDVVLTTPEYLALHTQDFASSGRVGFLVIDEAHHAGSASKANRAAYTQLDHIRSELGNPVSLAVTATASTPVAQEICRLLAIDTNDVIVDRSLRSNLEIVDYRNARDRDTVLASLVASGQKTVVYVNSRAQASLLARTIRQSVPDLAHRIAFYHAGLSRAVRLRVEKAFRNDTLSCVVATSAFGEGVNVASIRNVVLYHLPYCATEFNQMSGRVGRDGKSARVYLLFGHGDAAVNEKILWSQAPARNDLAVLYRALMTEDKNTGGSMLCLSDAELLARAQQIDAAVQLNEDAVSTGVLVFEELGFCGVEGYGDERRLRMVRSPRRVDLASSLRYTEGIHAFEEFEAFCDWALSSRPQEMLDCINRPITPDFGQAVDC